MRDAVHPSAEKLRSFFSLFFTNFGLIFKLNLFFTITSLSIVGIPAGLTAVNACLIRLIRDEPIRPWFDYKSDFKKEFLRSLVAGLILLFFFLLTGGGTWGYWQMAKGGALLFKWLSIFGGICFVLTLFASFSVFSMLAIVDLPVIPILRNGLILSVLRSPFHLLAFLFGSGLTIFYLRFFPLSLLAIPVFYVVPLTYATVWSAYGGIRKYVIKQE